jgi:hypothetical protein
MKTKKKIVKTTIKYKYPDKPYKTADQMEDICCEEKPELNCSEVYEGVWHGYSKEELIESLGISVDENDVFTDKDGKRKRLIIKVKPRKNPCGKIYTEYDTTPNACCEFATDIVWPDEVNTEVISAGNAASFMVTGGRATKTWKTTNSGTYWKKNGSRTITTSDSVVTLQTTENFCGATMISVSDGCSSVTEGVRSNVGRWELQTAEYPARGNPSSTVETYKTRIPPEFWGMSGDSSGGGVTIVRGRDKVSEGHDWYGPSFGAELELAASPDNPQTAFPCSVPNSGDKPSGCVPDMEAYAEVGCTCLSGGSASLCHLAFEMPDMADRNAPAAECPLFDEWNATFPDSWVERQNYISSARYCTGGHRVSHRVLWYRCHSGWEYVTGSHWRWVC